MKNTNKAFTLVELIVVITILAILGTIAFISLQGYSWDAKNSKVTSDLRNIVSAIEIDATKNSTALSDVIGTAVAANQVATSSTVWKEGDTAVALSTTTYAVGNIDFASIGQNGADFKDPNNSDSEYLFGYTSTGSFSGYQVAGRIVENDTNKVRINGNYVKSSTATAVGLIADNGVGGAGLADDATADLY